MKKILAFLLCIVTVISLISCRLDAGRSDRQGTDSAPTDEGTLEVGGENDEIFTQSPENVTAMQAYDAAIHDEILVLDERRGEIKLKDLRFSSNSESLAECKLLKKAVLDIDRDGINEYVIQSPEQEYLILRYRNGKVYSHCLDTCDYYKFNTDGTLYCYDSDTANGTDYGLRKISFEGETLKVESVYSIKYSADFSGYQYYVGERLTTEAEYYDIREQNKWYSKNEMRFTPFELTCSYPITAEQAWNLANAYWDEQDGQSEVSAGTIWTARIVLIDTPNSETNAYRVAFRVDWNSGGGLEGYEGVPPHSIKEHDQILVNAVTGEITTPAYDPNGKVFSIEEAIEIARNHCGGSYYAEYDTTEPAPDHIYTIVLYYDTDRRNFYTSMWIDKYTGEIVFSYYVW